MKCFINFTRAEALKGIRRTASNSKENAEAGLIKDLKVLSISQPKNKSFVPNEATVKPGAKVVGQGAYSQEEIDFLRATSAINRREYVPFLCNQYYFVVYFAYKN